MLIVEPPARRGLAPESADKRPKAQLGDDSCRRCADSEDGICDEHGPLMLELL